jgi:nucleotide-binding universal stress UspA family protein
MEPTMSENLEPTDSTRETPGAVVVGVDGSESAGIAAEWAAKEAIVRAAPLTLVHALNVPDVSVLEPSQVAQQARAEGRALADRVAARVHARFPETDLNTEVSDLAPAQALAAHSRTAALIVTGTRGHGGFAGMLVGSVSRKLAAHAHCPLVVVRGDTVTAAQPVSEVVLGVEPDQTEATIRYAFAAAERYGALLRAVRVWHPRTIYPSVTGGYYDDPGQAGNEQTREVEHLLGPFVTSYPTVKVEATAGLGNTVPVLIESARGARLLVVGAHRRRAPLSVGAGYVVDGLLAHSPTPVAVVPIR